MEYVFDMSSDDKSHAAQGFVEKFECPKCKSAVFLRSRLGEPYWRDAEKAEKVLAEARAVVAERQKGTS